MKFNLVNKRYFSVIFSGIQPSGILHIGNYLGALQQWKKLSLKTNNDIILYCIADLHSMTIPYNPLELKKYTK